MSQEIKTNHIEPMRVASFYGFGDQPEGIAWAKLEKWAKDRGMWQKLDKHPVFGFNNPDPTPASPNYGYELWLRISTEDTFKESDIIKNFDGGLYAVLRCPVPKGNYEVIGKKWKELVAWRENSQYMPGNHQWLEKSVKNDDPDLEFILDLYLPIGE